jgi:hypothetical protein
VFDGEDDEDEQQQERPAKKTKTAAPAPAKWEPEKELDDDDGGSEDGILLPNDDDDLAEETSSSEERLVSARIGRLTYNTPPKMRWTCVEATLFVLNGKDVKPSAKIASFDMVCTPSTLGSGVIRMLKMMVTTD